MVHPEVKKLYDAHPEIDRAKSTIDEIEEKFLNRTKNGGPKTDSIDQLWRTRKGGVRAVEYIWYLKRTTGKDHKGNNLGFVKPEGKWDMPIFSFEWEENEAEGRATGIQTWEERYDILFSKEKIQELYDSGMITAMTQFSIETGSRNYGGFSYEVFMERDFDDLVYFGQNGKFPTAEEKAILTAPPSKRMGIKNA